jgi:hypothetical protein
MDREKVKNEGKRREGKKKGKESMIARIHYQIQSQDIENGS